MPTIRVSADAPDIAVLERAAALLRAGRLVAFPTETVYGLGANAMDTAAIRRIYAAKGRPSRNPLIVHVASVALARELAAEWPELADILARRFWPGPLTLVVRKSPRIPDEVTGGGATVGIRVPAHPVALAILATAGIPLAAPSANRSNEISPTTAAHVARSLGDRVDLIIDGGATTVGIESTVVDVTGAQPIVLRPGMISADDITRALTGVKVVIGTDPSTDAVPRSPGTVGKHYAPRARVLLYGGADTAAARQAVGETLQSGRPAGAMVLASLRMSGITEQVMPGDAHAYARVLYETLHRLDDAGCALIVVEEPPNSEEWRGVRDRLQRAAIA
jgi:L-threonylcarbamoyladenylate synthase